MVEAVAKSHLELRQLLEVVADDVLVRHANTAMQLHGLLPDVAHGSTNLVFGAAHGAAAFCGAVVELQRGVVTHRTTEFELHLHVRHPVAQGLEGGNRYTKLLARVHVLDRDG